jgi:hypothetical protein
MRETLAPYEPVFRANNMDAHTAVKEMAHVAYVLNQGHDHQVADLMFGMLQRRRMSPELIKALDERIVAAANGQPMPSQGMQPQQPPVDQHSIQQMIAQALNAQRLQSEYQSFMATKPEFWEDVASDVEAILIADGKRGKDTTYEQAYQRAVWANEDTRKVLEQREAQKRAANVTAGTQRAKLAATSVKSTPATSPAQGPKPRNIREQLEASIARLSGG